MTARPRLVTRREALAAGVAAGGGVLLGGCSRPMPPTYGSLLRLGDNFTYVAHRTLLPGESLVREYSRAASLVLSRRRHDRSGIGETSGGRRDVSPLADQ